MLSNLTSTANGTSVISTALCFDIMVIKFRLYGAADLELFLDRINDLLKYRIEGVLEEITKLPLVQFKNDESMTPQEFLKSTQV